MIELSFADGRLRQGETELARVDDDQTLTVGDREYVVLRTKAHGWLYAVSERESLQRVCEFLPFRVRRGGSLKSGSTHVVMRAALLRAKSWRFIVEGNSRVDVSVTPSSRDLFRFTMTLRSKDSISVIANAPITLTFGCWLIANWEGIPAAVEPGSGPV
jgi:hypothetical protein